MNRKENAGILVTCRIIVELDDKKNIALRLVSQSCCGKT